VSVTDVPWVVAIAGTWTAWSFVLVPFVGGLAVGVFVAAYARWPIWIASVLAIPLLWAVLVIVGSKIWGPSPSCSCEGGIPWLIAMVTGIAGFLVGLLGGISVVSVRRSRLRRATAG
jgi:hypothetical protein